MKNETHLSNVGKTKKEQEKSGTLQDRKEAKMEMMDADDFIGSALYTHYHCPVCGEEMERDLSLFLTHTKEHILNLLRENYPELGPGEPSSLSLIHRGKN